MCNNLDADDVSCPRSKEHTEELIKTFSSSELWDEYGVDDDIIVSPLCVEVSLVYELKYTSPAVHERLPKGGHPCNHLPGYLTSAHQGDI